MRATLVFLLVIGATFPLQGKNAAQIGDPSQYHPWASCGVGSWKLVRVVREALDEEGRVESVSTEDTKATLIKVDEFGYTIKMEVTLEVAGKRFQAEPRFDTRGFNGETNGQNVAVKNLGDGEVTICGLRYPSQIYQVEMSGGEKKTTSTIHFSETLPPFVLKRETKTTHNDGTASNDSAVEVIAISMPHKVLTEVKPSAYVKTVHRQANGTTTVTIEVHCADVPGGVVAHTSKEMDPTGRIVRRSTLELIDYEILDGAPPQDRTPVLGRGRLFQRFRNRTKR